MILTNFTNNNFKSICPVYFTVALNKRNAITTDEMDEANATPIIPYLFDKNIFKRILIATPIIPLKAVVFVFSMANSDAFNISLTPVNGTESEYPNILKMSILQQ